MIPGKSESVVWSAGAVLFAALLAVSGCKKEPQNIAVRINPAANECVVDYNGVHIQVDQSVEFGYKAKSTRRESTAAQGLGFVGPGELASSGERRSKSVQEQATGITINGGKVEIIKGELRIGGYAYGQVKSGDRVVIDSEGVDVNGEFRGKLN